MESTLKINIPVIDTIHNEFEVLLEQLQNCKSEAFLGLFEELIEHTKDHFSFEEDMMRDFDFYGKQEHAQEHRVLLDEMEFFYQKAKKMPVFGKSYVHDYAHDKFKRHVMNIDSQFAMFLKEHSIELAPRKEILC